MVVISAPWVNFAPLAVPVMITKNKFIHAVFQSQKPRHCCTFLFFSGLVSVFLSILCWRQMFISLYNLVLLHTRWDGYIIKICWRQHGFIDVYQPFAFIHINNGAYFSPRLSFILLHFFHRSVLHNFWHCFKGLCMFSYLYLSFGLWLSSRSSLPSQHRKCSFEVNLNPGSSMLPSRVGGFIPRVRLRPLQQTKWL